MVSRDEGIRDMWDQPGRGPDKATGYKGTPNRWRARVVVNGREVSRSFRSKEMARAWRIQQLNALQTGDWISPKRGAVTFEEVAGAWLARPDVRESTRERDASYLRSMVLPRLGAMSVRSITPDDLDGLVRELTAEGKSSATIRKASQIAGAVLEDAVRRGLIVRSPHRGIRLPKLSDEEIQFLTAAEIHQVAGALRPDPEKKPKPPDYHGMALLGGFAGLRLGEVIGLQGGDIDRAARSIRVRRTATELASGVVAGPPKTRAAIRTVSVPEWVIDALPDREGWVFPDSEGGPLRARNWRRRVWRPAVDKAKFPKLRFHDLRHSHVALLISLGTDPKTIAERLGHKSVRTVLDVYGHLYESADRDVAAKLDALGT